MECGFGHLGRFSIDYRARFGESPKETRRRATGDELPTAPEPADRDRMRE
jgi:transcriptional regulator GlxA family with amidase domain